MENIIFQNYKSSLGEETKFIDLEFGIFFDGTKNNKDNSDARKAHTNSNEYQAFLEYGLDEKKQETSYYNDWSNVARLWKHYPEDNKIYIEGIGTGIDEIEGNQFAKDTLSGYALGFLATGVRMKVRKGCEYLAEKILKENDKAGDKTIIRTIYLDVFGFSRGAAAARNFVYEIFKNGYNAKKILLGGINSEFKDEDNKTVEKEKLPKGGHLGYLLEMANLDIKPHQIIVRFLGLYDTVSSTMSSIFDIHIRQNLPMPNFSNDVNHLHLNNLKAKKIIHFTARDEHRENFALTRIPYGIEKTFPGVHSDIGGGYYSGEEYVEEIETSWFAGNGLTDIKLIDAIKVFERLRKSLITNTEIDVSSLESYRSLLIKEGWFNDDEIYIKKEAYGHYRSLNSKRTLSNKYSFIPLHFMAESILEDNNNLINIDKLKKEYSINDDKFLVKIKAYLTKYIKDQEKEYPLEFEWFNNVIKYHKDKQQQDYLIQKQKDLRQLRNKYLHWSSTRASMGMDSGGTWYNLKNCASEGRRRKEYGKIESNRPYYFK